MMRQEIMAECLVVVWDQAPQWGKRQKKQGLIGKISLSEVSRAVAWGGGKGRHPFPSPDYLLACFAHQYFFPLRFSPNAEPGPRLVLLRYMSLNGF